MRRLALVVLVVIGLLVAAVAIAVTTLDPNQFRGVIAEQAGAALGRPVELGQLEIDILPLPSVRVQDVRVAGTGKDPDFARVAAIRLGISPLPLLMGQVVLRSVEFDQPRLHVPRNADGSPRLPGPKAGSAKAGSAKGESAEGESAEGDSAPAILISRFEVRQGRISFGAWEVTNLDASGSVGLDRAITAEVDADVAEVGSVRNVRITSSGPAAAQRVELAGDISALVLSELAKRVAPDSRVAGEASGRFRATLENGELASGALELDTRALRLQRDELEVTGNVPVQAELGKTFALDLSKAKVRYGELFEKPAGERLRVSGPLAAELPPRRLADLRLELFDQELRLEVDLGDRVRLKIAPAELELDRVARWLSTEPRGLRGRLRFEVLQVDTSPLGVRGALELSPLVVDLGDGVTIEAEGTVQGRGERLTWDDLEIRTAGELARTKGRYVLATGQAHVEANTEGFSLAPVVKAITGKPTLQGTLVGNLVLDGPLELASLRGAGHFEVAPGRIEGFSLIRALNSELVKLPLAVAHMKGRDISRYAREDFERLQGDFKLAAGRAELDPLTLAYEHATAVLQGSIGLEKGDLDFVGEVILSKAVDGELAGDGSGRPRVIPISRIRGTIDRPRVVVEPAIVARLFTAYATGGDLGRKIDEAVGPGTSEAIGGLLEELLRGGGKR